MWAAAGIAAVLALAALAGCSSHSFPPPATVEEVADRIDALRQRVAAEPGLALAESFAAAATATQQVPVGLLAAGFPDAADVVMSHPVFVAQWPDGGQLVIDPGLAARACPDFGKPAEWLGGEAIACAGETDPWAARIRPESVRRVAFSHLHVDHVSGLSEICRLCGDSRCRIPVALSPLQEQSNETHEADGREWLDQDDVAPCIVRQPLESDGDDATPRPMADELPGAYWMPLPGHTPGSQIFFLFRRDGGELRSYVVAGDVVNYAPAICSDGHPKPWAYRSFVVREDEVRQAWNRKLLRELDRRGFQVLVNHHLDAERSANGDDGAAARLCPDGES